MDDQRKTILIGGIYHGDIILAQASLMVELPSYVEGLDIGSLLPEDDEAKSIGQQVETWLGANPDAESLDPSIVRTILERAIGKGKFLSAIRCLEVLDEKDAYIEKYISDAMALVGDGNLREAAKTLVIASNLEIDEGIPLFQYLGATLHDACTSSPDKCVTRLRGDEAVLAALKYLIAAEKVLEAVTGLSAEKRKALLPFVALERDPGATEFYADYKKAHSDLEETQTGAIGAITDEVKQIEAVVASFAQAAERISAKPDTKESVEKLKRTAAGLRKDFAGVEVLIEGWQFHRLGDRIVRLTGLGEELRDVKDVVGKVDSSVEAAVVPVLDLIDDLKDKAILSDIEAIEQKLTSTQATMLGRQAHSQEHWQFLREIAFKYPVSPLMCCLRRINDRWMVVSQWDSEIVSLLREHFG
jgi:hypothetical protein